eukprot:5492234-Pleurochrysis_carterae.AAC.3
MNNSGPIPYDVGCAAQSMLATLPTDRPTASPRRATQPRAAVAAQQERAAVANLPGWSKGLRTTNRSSSVS